MSAAAGDDRAVAAGGQALCPGACQRAGSMQTFTVMYRLVRRGECRVCGRWFNRSAAGLVAKHKPPRVPAASSPGPVVPEGDR